jgi:[acyl-carrier-protein] S-malonyltransferase
VLIKRAELMDECFKNTEGAIMAIIGLKTDVVDQYLAQWRDQGHFIEISNHNCVGQLSVSGTKKAIELAYENIASIAPQKSVILPNKLPHSKRSRLGSPPTSWEWVFY